MIYNPGMRGTCALIFILFGLLAGVAPFSAFAEVRITEIMYDPSGSDSKREWIEVFNDGGAAVNLSELKFVDKNGHFLNVPPKNGGTGSMFLAGGRYAILASDATTFHTLFPGVSQVIDTTMSLNNTAATIGLTKNGSGVDAVTYSKTHGAAGDSDSLQLQGGVWIHAAPTPGGANASSPSVKTVAVPSKAEAPRPSSKQGAAPQKKAEESQSTKEDANDPLSVVNATTSSETISQTAAAGTLGGSMWWIAAGVLAVGTAATATLISRKKREEWDIEESD